MSLNIRDTELLDSRMRCIRGTPDPRTLGSLFRRIRAQDLTTGDEWTKCIANHQRYRTFWLVEIQCIRGLPDPMCVGDSQKATRIDGRNSTIFFEQKAPLGG